MSTSKCKCSGLTPFCECRSYYLKYLTALIHPSQVVVTNETFAPSDEEIDYSFRVVQCWEQAISEESFSGVAVLDGALVESLHVKTARKILDMANKIKEVESQSTLSGDRTTETQ